MEAEAQREILADAVKRGITLVELCRELMEDGRGNDIANMVLGDSGLSPVTPVTLERVPLQVSACPVMRALSDGAATLYEYMGLDPEPARWQQPEALRESTIEERWERTDRCLRWFRTKVLQKVESDSIVIPVADLSSAVRTVLFAETEIDSEEYDAIAKSVMEATLALFNSYGTECARQGKDRSASSVLLNVYSMLGDLLRMVLSPEEGAGIPNHVHPDSDLDRPLTLAEAARGTGEPPPEDTDLDEALRFAGEHLGLESAALSPVFIPAPDDMSPGGVLKT